MNFISFSFLSLFIRSIFHGKNSFNGGFMQNDSYLQEQGFREKKTVKETEKWWKKY